MKKILAIIILGLLLQGCETTGVKQYNFKTPEEFERFTKSQGYKYLIQLIKQFLQMNK